MMGVFAMSRSIFVILLLCLSSVSFASNDCVMGIDSTNQSGLGKLGTSYDYYTSSISNNESINLNLVGLTKNLQFGDSAIFTLNINSMPRGAKPNYFWKDSCSNKITSTNKNCTQVKVTALEDINKTCYLQVEAQDGFGLSKIASFNYQVNSINSSYDYSLEISPKYIEGELNKKSIFNLALKHNSPAYDKVITLKKDCYFNEELEWSDSLTYAPDFDQEHTWYYVPFNGHGLRRCDLSVIVDGDIDSSNNFASVFINTTDPNPVQNNKDIYISSVSLEKYNDILPGDFIDITGVQAFSGTTENHFVSSIGYFLSTDKYFSDDDQQVASSNSGLNNQITSDEDESRWKVAKDQAAGTYYILVVAHYKKEHAETNESNNVYPIKVTIKEKESNYSDLTIPAIQTNNYQVEKNKNITLTLKVSNIGNDNVSYGYINFYRSNDSVISTSDSYVSGVSINNITANNHIGVSSNLTVPNSAGTYWYGACVTSVANESNTANNCSNGLKIEVTERNVPKLSLSEFSLGANSPFELNKTVNVSLVIANLGGKESEPNTAAVYLSSDNSLSIGDRNIQQFSMPSVGANQTSTINGTIKFTEIDLGNHWIFACVSPSVQSDYGSSTNNCSTPKLIKIEEATPTPIISNITPTTATLGQETIFTITGSGFRHNISSTISFSVDGCSYPIVLPNTDTKAEFNCKFSSAGQKQGKVVNTITGSIIKTFSVNVESSQSLANTINLWVDANYMIHRSDYIDAGKISALEWVIKRNGKTVLQRNAKNETSYKYFANTTGYYTVYVQGYVDGQYRTLSNTVNYTVP